MKGIDRSGTKIKEIEKLLAEVKHKLKDKELPGKPPAKEESKNAPDTDRPRQEREHVPARKSVAADILPPESDFRGEYERMYREFEARKFQSVRNFIGGKSKTYLKAFCRANSLPIDAARASKEKIYEEVMLWLARRRAVTKRIT